MREIDLKFAGDCRKCRASLDVGAKAAYERRVGIFCLPCTPTDPEEIRGYRQEQAERKAVRYSEWAAKRTARAQAVLKRHEVFTGDIAFNTQPGHIPMRAQIIRQDDRARESLQVAQQMQAKAAQLRMPARVQGDAEREREEKRRAIREKLAVGMKVYTGIYGNGVVERINRKTATIGKCGSGSDYRVAVDLSWLVILPDSANVGIA